MHDNEALVRRLYQAIADRAPAAEIATYWHPRAQQIEYPSLMRPSGHRRPLREMLDGYAKGLALIAQQDHTVLNVVVDDDRMAVQARWNATTAIEAGPLPAGAELVAFVALFYDFEDGLILRQSTYDCYEPLPT